MKSKKGINNEILPEMILVVVVGVVIFLITTQTTNLFGEKSKKEQCTSSLLAMQQSTMQVGTVELKGSTWHPKCPKDAITISKLDKNAQMESARRQVAEAIRNCVEKCGNCNMDPFAARLFNAKYYCIVCSQIKFSEGVRKAIPTLTGVMEYLKTNKPANSQLTYFGEFMSRRYCTDESGSSMFTTSDFEEMNTSKQYALVYIFDKFSKVQFGSNIIQQIRMMPEEDIGKIPKEDDPCSEIYQ